MSGFHYIEFEKTGSILLNADEKDELFDYLDRLKAENEQLRKERDFFFQQVTDNGERAHGAIDALNAENANLRELVMIAVKHCDSGTCDGCPIQGESGSCPYSDMARELGVDV